MSVPTFILQNMFQSFFVTAEKPNLGFAVTVGAGVTNMVLDVVLVGLLGWSVESAAIATFISQIVGGVLPVFYFLNRNNTSRLHLRRPRFNGRVRVCPFSLLSERGSYEAERKNQAGS